jgi:uncharacterized membrane protein YbhN (UPF0104 family)
MDFKKYLDKNQFPNLKRFLMVLQYLVVVVIFIFLFKWSRGIKVPPLDATWILWSALSVLTLRFLSVIRLGRILRKLMVINTTKLLPVQFLSVSLGLLTPGKMGESIKILMLGKNAEEKKKVGAVFLLEKIMDTIIFLPLALVFIIMNGVYVKYFLGLLLFLILAVYLYFKAKKFSEINVKLLKWDVVLITIAQFIIQILSFWFVILASGNQVSFVKIAVIWSIGGIITIISTLPGGLGARELSLAYLLSLLAGVENSVAVSLAIVYTIINYSTTWFSTLVVKIAFWNQ